MNRRTLGIIAALVLAGLGTLALVTYVDGAEERARSGEELVDVYVVVSPVAAGTSGADIGELVSRQQVPLRVRATDAVTNLAEVSDLVATVDLLDGEQLVGERFGAIDETQRSELIDVPADLLEVTVELPDRQRVLGGSLRPGDLVAIVASFEPFDIEPIDLEGTVLDGISALPENLSQEARTPNSSGMILRKALVTAVQQSSDQVDRTDPESELQTAPRGGLIVTLATDDQSVERLVFAMEYGEIWIARESSRTPEATTEPQTRRNVYGDQPSLVELTVLP